MYDNIGNKIKSLAIVAAIIETIVSVIAGISFLFFESEMKLIGVFLLFFAPFIVFAFSWLIYGFGDLINNVNYISKNIGTGEKINEYESKMENKERELQLEKLHKQGLITEEEYLQAISKDN